MQSTMISMLYKKSNEILSGKHLVLERNSKKGTMDTVIVKSVSIESFEKKRVTITITIKIKEMYI